MDQEIVGPEIHSTRGETMAHEIHSTRGEILAHEIVNPVMVLEDRTPMVVPDIEVPDIEVPSCLVTLKPLNREGTIGHQSSNQLH